MSLLFSADAQAHRSFPTPVQFASAARAARYAARLWFQSDTDLPASKFRDQQFLEYCEGRSDNDRERKVRRETFCLAFAVAIGHIVVEEGRFNAATP